MRNNRRVPLIAQTGREMLEHEEFFLKKFSFLKKEVESYLNEYTDVPMKFIHKLQRLWTPAPNHYIYSSSSANQESKRRNKFISLEKWTLYPILTQQQYYNILDAMHTSLNENELVVQLNIQIRQSYLLGLLLIINTLPFIKRVEMVQINFPIDSDLFCRMKNNDNLRVAVNDCQQLITKMILIRKSITQLQMQTLGSSEQFCLGISQIDVQKGHSLKQFSTKNLFYEATSASVTLALETLSKFKNLEDVELGQVNLSQSETVLSLNKILLKAKIIKITFSQLDLNEERIQLLQFANRYQSLSITYSIDELSHPKKLDLFFQQLSIIKKVDYLFLSNSFTLNQFPPSKASTVIKNTNELIKILPGSVVLEEKLMKEKSENEKELQQEENDFQPANQWQFLERLKNTEIKHLNLYGLIHKRLCNTLLSLCRYKKLKYLQLNQLQLNTQYILNVPFSIKQVFEKESDIDLNDLYSIADKFSSFQFQIFTKRQSINLMNKCLSITISSQSNSLPKLIFKPFDIKINGLTQLDIATSGLTDLSIFEQICKSASQNHSLTLVNLSIQFSSDLQKKVTYNTLHSQLIELEGQSFKYLGLLASLPKLKNIVLTLNFDQKIIDSVEYLLINSQSLKTIILRRNSIQQFTLDFSKVIATIQRSKRITHALLDLKLEQIQIVDPSHQKIFEEYKFKTLYLPISQLLEDPMCNLKTLELFEQDVIKKGMSEMLMSLLKQQNKTVLGFFHQKMKHNELNKELKHLYTEARSKNLLKTAHYYNDNCKFITQF